MKHTLLKYGGVFTFLILSAAALMHISQNVQKLERDIASYDREIEHEQEKIRVLKAEWAYLNNPARLEALSTGGYDLHAPEADALVRDPSRLPGIIPSSGA